MFILKYKKKIFAGMLKKCQKVQKEPKSKKKVPKSAKQRQTG